VCILLHIYSGRNDQDSYRFTEKYLLCKSPKSLQHRTLIQGNHSALKIRQSPRERIDFLPLLPLPLGEDPYNSGRTLSKLNGSILDLRFFSSGQKRFDSEFSAVMNGGTRSRGDWAGTILRKLAFRPNRWKIQQQWSLRHVTDLEFIPLCKSLCGRNEWQGSCKQLV
jgi:hypothetical protein